MSSFTGKIIVEKIGPYQWEVYTPFEYHVGDEYSKDIITIPKGLSTDFASVPRLFWIFFPPDGQYTAASLVHDFLYSIVGEIKLPYNTKKRTRVQCDYIFKEAMKCLEVNWFVRGTMYRAVRLFGWMPWNNGARKKKKQQKEKK